MKRQLGLKYRLDPTPHQAARLRVLAGHARFVWNQALAECHAARERGERVPRYGTMAGWITTWKRQEATPFLTEAYTDNLQQKLRDLDTAWQRHFTPAWPPMRLASRRKASHATVSDSSISPNTAGSIIAA